MQPRRRRSAGVDVGGCCCCHSIRLCPAANCLEFHILAGLPSNFQATLQAPGRPGRKMNDCEICAAGRPTGVQLPHALAFKWASVAALLCHICAQISAAREPKWQAGRPSVFVLAWELESERASERVQLDDRRRAARTHRPPLVWWARTQTRRGPKQMHARAHN